MKNKHKWKYDDYSKWSHMLAMNYTRDQLNEKLNDLEGLSDQYAKQHREAIEASTSMSSNSMRRAHSRNNVSSNYEELNAINNAIEIHEFYPEKCMNNWNNPG